MDPSVSSNWPQIQGPPALISPVLGLQACPGILMAIRYKALFYTPVMLND